MDRHKAMVFVFRCAVGTAAADVEHAQIATVELNIRPLQLFQFANTKSGIGQCRKDKTVDVEQ